MRGSISGLEDFFVSTAGRDEQAIRECINKQEAEDKRLDQLNLWQ